MNINEAFPSNYIKASDLKGQTVQVAIDRVEMEEVGRTKDRKAVVYFKGKEKGLVLNKTNANKIIQLSGSPATEDWRGFVVSLYPTETEFGGEQVECVRVKAAPKTNGQRPPQAAPPPPPPPPPQPMPEPGEFDGPLTDDDIPFVWLLALIIPGLHFLLPHVGMLLS